MNKHTCDTCSQTIAAGQAVIRSINFQRVAWHRECYAYNVLPAQRSAEQAVRR